MAIHYVKTLVLSSMDRIFPECDPEERGLTSLSCLRNEPLSLQVAYKLISNQSFTEGVYARIECDLPVTLYAIGYVPVLQTRDSYHGDAYRPGLFGDVLLPKRTNPPINTASYPWAPNYIEGDKTLLHARSDSWQGLWLTVNEDERRLAAGSYPLRITFHSTKDRTLLGEAALTVKLLPALLPRQTLKVTNWFYCDCLCDTYGVEPFSERFFEIFADYVKKAARNGTNTLLTPCFTPPLDTPVDGERMTVQLVDVVLEGDTYSFDFSKLGRFMDIAGACGVTYFEHSHLFTQWGAKHAPKVMATVNGKYRRLFGWDTVAWGKKYTAFLRAYLTALIAFLKERGQDKNFIYHVSDEPGPNSHEGYRRAKAALGGLLDGYTVCDALSHYELYADGTVSTPVVNIPYVKDFYGRVKELWIYHTGSRADMGYPNRKLTCTGERNRMLGIQMYMHGVKGFLHWGYNYWYGLQSQGLCDPKMDPTFFSGGGSGSPFLVYPALDGTCLQSIRQKLFYEAVNDMRALLALERYIGKRATRAFVEDYYGRVTFETHLGDATRLLAFREALNARIAACTQ